MRIGCIFLIFVLIQQGHNYRHPSSHDKTTPFASALASSCEHCGYGRPVYMVPILFTPIWSLSLSLTGSRCSDTFRYSLHCITCRPPSEADVHQLSLSAVSRRITVSHAAQLINEHTPSHGEPVEKSFMVRDMDIDEEES